uniref:Protein Hook homolog 3 n=1 Tax=Sparus aurata TaxID=8175 RepID=A0A671XCP6_SPAAU
ALTTSEVCRSSERDYIVYFNDAWISRIKPEVGDNWRLKISNLKKILKGILDYNQEILGQHINDFTLPDVNLIGEHSDAAELGRMLQLILGCAVNCEQKQENQVLMERLNQSDSIEDINSPAGRRHLQLIFILFINLSLSVQVVELQNRLSEESKKADKMEFEYKRVKEKVDSLQKEKDRMRTERDSLKETIEELHCVQAQEGQLTSGLFPLTSNDGSDSLAAEITTPEIREHLIRLQHENKMLKLAQEGSDNEKIALLQSLLEDANRRKNELETENRLINQRLMEEQSQVEELQKSLQEQDSKADDVSNECLKLRELNNELLKKNSFIDEMEPKYNASSQRVDELEEALKKKDEDMKQMEERYKKYLEKAKSVIRTLDPKQNQGSGPEVQALKNQLQEKERMLHSLEKEMDKTKGQRDYEEKLIVSAWYNMGMSLQKKAAEDRLANTGSGQSFLARQRQATSTRRSFPGHVQPATAR